MGVTLVPRVQALGPGADLWVIGSPESSSWALKIDWELNFQVLRASRHVKPAISTELADVISRTGLEMHETRLRSPALLVASDLNLPCRWVLSMTEWNPNEIKQAWQDLGMPAVRLFLPPSLSVDSWEGQWGDVSGDFQVVADQTLN